MSFDRRKFLRTTGLFASGIALGANACNTESKKENAADSTATTDTTSQAAADGTPLPLFGIQLYSVRDDIPKNPKGILKQLAGFGFKQAEGFEGKQGIFWE